MEVFSYENNTNSMDIHPEKINLLVVDDHVIIRRGLKFFLDSHFGIRSFHEADTCIAVREMAVSFEISHIIWNNYLT